MKTTVSEDEEITARAIISDAVFSRIYACETAEEMLAEFRRARHEYGDLAVRSILSKCETDNGHKKHITRPAHALLFADHRDHIFRMTGQRI